MSQSEEGYVLTTYGAERYLQQAVASVVTLRRHDKRRPVALYCTEQHQQLLLEKGLGRLFDQLAYLPPAHRSIVGVKHHLDAFMPFERTLWVDADMVWCRNPDPLWQQLAAYSFTATGLEKADLWFGGPKGLGIIREYLLDRRRQTLQRFGLSHLPRVQSGMMFGQDKTVTRKVCRQAADFLERQAETHFISRTNEKGRSLESCEWSLAMAMSHKQLPVYPWFQGYYSPQLDFIKGLTRYDDDFKKVSCLYYCDELVYSLRGIPLEPLRKGLIRLISLLPGRGDYMEVTPFALHFGWYHQKKPFEAFAKRTWERLVEVDNVSPLTV